jgi:hypothetical protein
MSEFTWNEKCDPEIMNHGDWVIITEGSTVDNQTMVETISNRINVKLDWVFAGGRGLIRCMPGDGNAEAAKSAFKELYPDGSFGERGHLLMMY